MRTTNSKVRSERPESGAVDCVLEIVDRQQRFCLLIEQWDRVTSYIFVHDQRIIRLYESVGKFDSLRPYRYVFLGGRDVSQIRSIPEVIVARELETNIECAPHLVAFTGWYALHHNSLLHGSEFCFLEYDVRLLLGVRGKIEHAVAAGSKCLGFLPHPTSANFLDYSDVREVLLPKIAQCYGGAAVIRLAAEISAERFWLATSNIVFHRELFNGFMNWFTPLIPAVTASPSGGHLFERAISIYLFLHQLRFQFAEGCIEHLQLDSHDTQQMRIYRDSDEFFREILV